MKVRQYKLRKPRNPITVMLRQKRGGEHKKSNKALRRAANSRLTKNSADE